MKICLALLIIFHLFYFFPFYFTENVISQRDLLFLTLPDKFEAVYQWRNGVIPFWEDKLSNGQPLLANPTSSSLYPLMLPLIIFPNLKTFTFICLFHHLLFLIGGFLFANLILKNPYFGLLLSTFIGYNGITVEFFSFCNPLWGITYLPWCLFFYYKFLIKNKKSYLILTSFLFSLSIFAGFDLSPFLFSFFLLILTIYVNYKKILNFLLCLFLAFLFSAPQTIPSISYVPNTTRAEKQYFYEDSFGFYSFHPLRAIEIFIPKFHGTKSSKGNEKFWADVISDKDEGLFINPYFGLFSILLLISLRPFKKRWIFISFTILFLILSFGRYFPLHFILLKIPLFSNIRFPEKFLIFLMFFFYIFLIENLRDFKKISILPSLIISSSILILILLNKLFSGEIFKNYLSFTTYQEIKAQPFLMERYLFISLLFSIIFLFSFYLSKKIKNIYFLFPILCFIDLFYGSHNRIVPYSQNTIKSPLIRILKEQNSLRIMHIEESVEYNLENKNVGAFRIETLYPNIGVLFGFSYAFASSVDSMEPSLFNKKIEDIDLKMWGVSHIILSGKKGPKGEDLHRFKGYELWHINKNPTFIWFLNERTKEAEPLPPILKMKNPSKLKFKMKNKDDGILWIGFSNLPGWTIYINGKKSKMANPSSEGLNVFLKSGENKVEFIYCPPGFWTGIILFSTGIILCVIIFLWKRKD